MEDQKIIALFESLTNNINRQFEGVHQRLDGIDGRLEKVEQRLDKVEQRLDKVELELKENRAEHQQLMQAINEINNTRFEIKRVYQGRVI